ncbi:MAG TPA: ABC transporter ATP-binding protein [Anaerolineae bacterium]|nr:ABC transporter ATP-binding protein [Anaerolineae bacterium]HID85507.1 ABC transporter ATP-binding protein [Anaerolineales bacterium]HIQ08757.1 ABC transporter ATP-binding protein [Anaerolineaceae bacterium]
MTDIDAIRTEKLTRVYTLRGCKKQKVRELVALRGVTLTVPRGELFGLLGPNGAGKTTLIKILTTLLAPSSGRAWVLGHDVMTEAEAVRPRINMVSGGETSGYGLLTVRENLWLFAQLYGIPSSEANRRIEELLAMVGMADRMHTKSSELSTGLRQKMNIVRGFLTDPEVLFLDEPTLGLDVGAARDVRRMVRQWMAANPQRTILLTTHYMHEAEELCDRVAIINRGEVLACDTPANLKRALQQESLFVLETTPLNGLSPQDLEHLPGVKRIGYRLVPGGSRLDCHLEDDAALGPLVSALTARGVRLRSLQKREPTLEDVFVHLVGRSMAEEESAHA